MKLQTMCCEETCKSSKTLSGNHLMDNNDFIHINTSKPCAIQILLMQLICNCTGSHVITGINQIKCERKYDHKPQQTISKTYQSQMNNISLVN